MDLVIERSQQLCFEALEIEFVPSKRLALAEAGKLLRSRQFFVEIVDRLKILRGLRISVIELTKKLVGLT